MCDATTTIKSYRVGSSLRTTKVRITSINYDKNMLTVEKAVSWKKGDTVNLSYKGDAPDIGPFEH